MKLTAYLYDVAQQRRMMGKNFSGDAGDVPRMARRFADAILEAATGQKGPFDSKLAFVSTRGGRFKEIYTQSIDGAGPFQADRQSDHQPVPELRSDHALSCSTCRSRAWRRRCTWPTCRRTRETKIDSPHGRVIGGTISPDGERIVASIERDGITNLYLLTREGDEIRQLTDTSGINVSPAFSPDGGTLAFTSDRSGTPQIYLMSLAGGAPKRITYSGDYNTTPAFSPKGDKLAYQSRDNGRFDIFTIPAGGGDPVQVTDGNGSNEYPSWSPDGRYIAFSSTRGHNSRIYILMVSNRKIISALTEGNGNDSCPAWSGWLGE